MRRLCRVSENLIGKSLELQHVGNILCGDVGGMFDVHCFGRSVDIKRDENRESLQRLADHGNLRSTTNTRDVERRLLQNGLFVLRFQYFFDIHA